MSLIENLISLQSYRFALLVTFVVFVLVYRVGLNRWLCLQYPKLKKLKFFYCSTCFGFWVCVALSFNIVTSASAFLIFNIYENNQKNR